MKEINRYWRQFLNQRQSMFISHKFWYSENSRVKNWDDLKNPSIQTIPFLIFHYPGSDLNTCTMYILHLWRRKNTYYNWFMIIVQYKKESYQMDGWIKLRVKRVRDVCFQRICVRFLKIFFNTFWCLFNFD